MQLRKHAIAVSFVALFAAGAAAEDVSQRAVSNPGAFWDVWGMAKTNYVAAPQLKGGAVQRVTVSPQPRHPWEAGTYAAINKPVKKGDVLVLTFWARAQKPPPGNNLVMVSGRIYEAGPSGGGVSPETSFVIGKSWKFYSAAGIAAKDYPAGSLSAGMVLGTGEQVIDFGPVTVFDYGPGYNFRDLPLQDDWGFR